MSVEKRKISSCRWLIAIIFTSIVFVTAFCIVLLTFDPSARIKRVSRTQLSSPHIVFILADDLGYNDIGYHAVHGMSAVRTPYLDALANEGVKLENYYVQPICSPSRSVLMTGRYLIRYGLQHDVFHAPQPTCLPMSETLLPQKLSELGYSTHAVGKWHLGFCRTECLPTYRGFDTFFGYAAGGQNHYTHNKSVSGDFDVGTKKTKHITMSGKDLWDGDKTVWNHEGEYSSHMFTKRAVDIVRNHDPQTPLFLYLAYKNVHTPLEVPDKYVKMHKGIRNKDRQKYAAMASALDEGVQQVRNALQDVGMWNNTVLVFSSDNGGHLQGEGNNWPLRGSKWDYWEGGIRAVGFVNSPLLADNVKGTTNKQLMHISDWFPTFVDGIAGGNTSAMEANLDGHNQWDTIRRGNTTQREEILHNIDPSSTYHSVDGKEWSYWKNHMHIDTFKPFYPKIAAAIRRGKWKLLTGDYSKNGAWTPPPESGLNTKVVKERNKNKCPHFSATIQLFNIEEDPLETCNVSQEPKNRAIVIDLLKRLQSYYKESTPVFHPPWDFRADPKLHGRAWRPWLDDDLSAMQKIYRFLFHPFM